MRLKIASVLLLAGTVVGCASNPPPPPPMAMAPEPAPMAAPMAPMAPMAGTYRGKGEAQGSSSCRTPKGMMTARVRGNTIMVAGMRGMIGPDGTVTGKNLSGTVSGNMADVTVKRGVCMFEYKMTNGKAMPMSMPTDGAPSTGM